MEFDYVGTHCSISSCHQQDFLPFTCEVCKGCYCLDHRSFSAHGCHGEALRDMTSISCPICNKTVKFNKSQDLDLVWEDHYLNTCSQVATSPKKMSERCSSASCNIHLGPSNKYRCTKCNQLVCLTHRDPEDHQCSSCSKKPIVSAKAVEKKQPSQTKVITQPTPSQIPLRNEEFLSRFDNSSSGSRQKSQSKSAPVVQTQSLPSSSAGNTAVCPMCNARFLDPVALVNHFESSHENPPTAATSSQPLQSKNNCNMS